MNIQNIPNELLQFARPLTNGIVFLDPEKGHILPRRPKPKKVKHYTDRTYSRVRTRSLRRCAGSRALKPKYGSPKRRNRFPMLSGNGGQQSYPMNLNASSNFLDIETLFSSSAYNRASSGRPQLATYYS